jgi:hypothetical protein
MTGKAGQLRPPRRHFDGFIALNIFVIPAKAGTQSGVAAGFPE